MTKQVPASDGILIAQNVTAKVVGDKLILELDISKEARESAPPSTSGKMKLIANSGGWQAVPIAAAAGLRLNLGLGFKV